MLFLIRYLRTAVIAVGLFSLVCVLFPNHIEPLWHWAKFVSSSVGTDALPTFEQTQHMSSLALAGFVICGIALNWWRSRSYRALQAEYAYQTGATHLKEKVAELETQLRKMTKERDNWEEAYLTLTKQHAAALVTSKEHEVRSEYGKADHEALGTLRKEFDAIVQAKGHIEGFREAMNFFLTRLSDSAEPVEVSVKPSSNGSSKPHAALDKHTTLPSRSSLRS